jgi:hypothetical protein
MTSTYAEVLQSKPLSAAMGTLTSHDERVFLGVSFKNDLVGDSSKAYRRTVEEHIREGKAIALDRHIDLNTERKITS